jgi:hypothetical protein
MARVDIQHKHYRKAIPARSSQLADCVNLSAMAVRFAHP